MNMLEVVRVMNRMLDDVRRAKIRSQIVRMNNKELTKTLISAKI